MSSTIGDALKVTIFGESHGEAIGVVMEGLPPGEAIDMAELRAFLARRVPGRALGTARREEDEPTFVSGLRDGRVCGTPLCALIGNRDAKPGDYAEFIDRPRPSHADFPALIRYGGHADMRGGGHFSGRLTAPMCVAGGIALQILGRRGIHIGAHLVRVGRAEGRRFDPVNLTAAELLLPGARPFPALDEEAGRAMAMEIETVAARGDSVGGIVECAAVGVPPGAGDPMFGGVENRIVRIAFGIPAVRGVEFGTGFEAGAMLGSEHNDPYHIATGEVRTITNHHGGAIGGITSGMPIMLRVAFKPTPSIGLRQRTVRLSDQSETELTIGGRHDPCVALRAVPCVEAAMALAILDLLLEGAGRNGFAGDAGRDRRD